MEKSIGYVLSGIAIAGGIVGAACMLAGAVRDFKAADRYVTVKGLVEKEVKADLAIWNIKFKVSGEDLAALQQQATAQRSSVMTFLTGRGVKPEDVSASLRVIDRKSQEYGEARADQSRFIIETAVQIRSRDVDIVRTASQQTEELVKQGVVLAEDNSCSPGPSYTFTGLNDIKPEMLAQATANARKAAEQFAADSGSKVGSIRRANQGVFSLDERDRVAENSDGGGCNAATPNKKVRVVTTVDYFLAE